MDNYYGKDYIRWNEIYTSLISNHNKFNNTPQDINIFKKINNKIIETKECIKIKAIKNVFRNIFKDQISESILVKIKTYCDYNIFIQSGMSYYYRLTESYIYNNHIDNDKNYLGTFNKEQKNNMIYIPEISTTKSLWAEGQNKSNLELVSHILNGKNNDTGLFSLKIRDLLISNVPRSGNSFYFAVLKSLYNKMYMNPNIIPVEYYKLTDTITTQTIIKLEQELKNINDNNDEIEYLSQDNILDFNGLFMNEDEFSESNTVNKGERFIDNDIFIKIWNMIVYYLYIEYQDDDIIKDNKKEQNFDMKKRPFNKDILDYLDDNNKINDFKEHNKHFNNLAKLLRLITILYLYEKDDERMNIKNDPDISREGNLLSGKERTITNDKKNGKLGYLNNKLNSIKDVDNLMISALVNILNLPIVLYYGNLTLNGSNDIEIPLTDNVKLFLPCNNNLTVINDIKNKSSNIEIDNKWYNSKELQDYLVKNAIVLRFEKNTGAYQSTFISITDTFKMDEIKRDLEMRSNKVNNDEESETTNIKNNYNSSFKTLTDKIVSLNTKLETIGSIDKLNETLNISQTERLDKGTFSGKFLDINNRIKEHISSKLTGIIEDYNSYDNKEKSDIVTTYKKILTENTVFKFKFQNDKFLQEIETTKDNKTFVDEYINKIKPDGEPLPGNFNNFSRKLRQSNLLEQIITDINSTYQVVKEVNDIKIGNYNKQASELSKKINTQKLMKVKKSILDNIEILVVGK